VGFLWGRTGMGRVVMEQCLTFAFCNRNCFSLTFQSAGDFPLFPTNAKSTREGATFEWKDGPQFLGE